MTATSRRTLLVALALAAPLLAAAHCPRECDEEFLPPSPDAARMVSLEEACLGSAAQALCAALRRAGSAPDDEARRYFRKARAEAEALVHRDRVAAIRDPAVRWYLRERATSLLVWYDWYLETEPTGSPPLPGDWQTIAEERLREHFPIHDPREFRLAMVGLAPTEAPCRGGRAALVVFPGVVRTLKRDEFTLQLEALANAEASGLECIAFSRAETRTFVVPEENADAGCRALKEVREVHGADVPIHLLGYSQGARNALETLRACPSEAKQLRSLWLLNSAAHGSPIGDIGALLVPDQPFALPDMKPAQVALAYGLALDPRNPSALGDWLEAEGFEGDLEAFLAARFRGFRSLSTYAARDFWTALGDGWSLPRDFLVVSFRSIVTHPRRNLPKSNCPLFLINRRLVDCSKDNDMQVRLVDQQLGGPFADMEVVGPVAEGNHWQWALNPGDVPPEVMPDEMLRRTPSEALFLAHYRTLDEVGLLSGGSP